MTRGWAAAGDRDTTAAKLGCGFGATSDVQLLQDVVDVILDGRDLNHETPGDFLVAQPIVDELEDLRFACRQPNRLRLGRS
jgi:hypothetical protein